MSEKQSTNLKCESCGEEFSCGAKIGKCWCFEVEVEKETLEQLREDFSDCLCKNCLNAVDKKAKTIAS